MSYNPSKSPKQSNKIQKSKSKSKSPNKSSPSKISNKTRKSLSPNKNDDVKDTAFHIFYQANPNLIETLKLFSTNTKYKKQFSYVDELDTKIQTFNNNITKLKNFITESHAKMFNLENRIYELEDDATTKPVKKEINTMMKSINIEIKKANNDIEKYELMIEDYGFIRKIWISTKIDDATKQTYTDNYNTFIKQNRTKVDKIQKQIEINKKQKSQDKYESVFKKNMDKWKILNEERRQFTNDILTKL